MYRIYMTNFGYFKDGEFDDIEEAKKIAKATGFETTIYKGDENIGGHYGVSLSWRKNTW